jgi:hypothetical protein
MIQCGLAQPLRQAAPAKASNPAMRSTIEWFISPPSAPSPVYAITTPGRIRKRLRQVKCKVAVSRLLGLQGDLLQLAAARQQYGQEATGM